MKLIKSTRLFALGSAAAAFAFGHSVQAGTVMAADGKTSKEVKIEEKAEENPVVINTTIGYDSAYIFRGVNLLDASSGGGNLLTADINLNAYGFTFGAWYAQSIKEGNKSRDYNELDVYLSYTHSVGPVDLTGGYIYYLFPKQNDSVPEDDYYTQEFFASIAGNSIPYVTPSLSFYYDYDKFNGGYLEFKLASSFPIIKDFVTIDPYALISYDFEYNSDDTDFNNVQAGINVPFKVSPSCTISGYASISYALDALNQYDDYEVWGGGKVSFSF